MSIFKRIVELQHQFNKQVAEDYLDTKTFKVFE